MKNVYYALLNENGKEIARSATPHHGWVRRTTDSTVLPAPVFKEEYEKEQAAIAAKREETTKVKKAPAYYKYHYKNAKLTREELLEDKVKVVRYYKTWDYATASYEYRWDLSEEPLTKVSTEFRVPTKKAVEKELTLKTGQKFPWKDHNPMMNEFIKKLMLEETDTTTIRHGYAKLHTVVEDYNQRKIEQYPIWKALAKDKVKQKYETITLINDAQLRKDATGIKTDYSKYSEEFRDVMLTRAADYGITPQENTITSKELYTFQKAELEEESDDTILEREFKRQDRIALQTPYKGGFKLPQTKLTRLVDKVAHHNKLKQFIQDYKPERTLDAILNEEHPKLKHLRLSRIRSSYPDYWLRPWKTYRKDIAKDDPIVSVVGRWTQTVTPTYKEDEAMAIAERIKRSPYASEFIDMVEVWNTDYDVILPSFHQSKVMEALYKLAHAKPEKVQRWETDSIFSKVQTFYDYSSIVADTDYEYPDLVEDLDVLGKTEDIVLHAQANDFIERYNELLDVSLGEISKTTYNYKVQLLQHSAATLIDEYAKRRERTQVITHGEDLVKLVPRSELRLNDYEEYIVERRDFQTEVDTVDSDEVDEYYLLGYDITDSVEPEEEEEFEEA